MKNNLIFVSTISLIMVVILLVLTKGEWIRFLSPFLSIVDEQSDLIQSIDSLISIILVILNVIWVYVSWVIKKSDRKNIFDEPPIIPINLNQLIARLGRYGSEIPWIDRGTTNISLIRSNPRILILGQRKFGKTRESIELIRRVINHELIQETRIFQLSPSFRFYNPSALKRSIEVNLDISEPALLFIDDFVHFYFNNSLILIEETIEVLKKCREFYFIITASEEEITDQHLEWFEKTKFSLVRLEQPSRDQVEKFLEGAADALNLLIENDAREIFINRSNGIPENVLIGFRRLLSDRFPHFRLIFTYSSLGLGNVPSSSVSVRENFTAKGIEAT